MPIIHVNWTVGQTKAEKRAFIEDVAKIVSDAIQVPTEVVNVLLHELPEENVRFPEAVFTIRWSKHPNRNKAAKAIIIEKLTQRVLEISNITPEKIVLFFYDLDGENVGVAGKSR